MMNCAYFCRQAAVGIVLAVASGPAVASDAADSGDARAPSSTPRVQTEGLRRSGGSPSRGLRPIGSPSPVDGFAGAPRRGGHPSTTPSAAAAAASPVAQTAYMQGGSGFQMPPGGAAGPTPPPTSTTTPSPGAAPPVTGRGAITTPGDQTQLQPPPLHDDGSRTTPAPSGPATNSLPDGLQPVPSTGAPLTAPPGRGLQNPGSTIISPSDTTPVPQPQLGSSWATADNCNLVTGPSGYRAEFGPCTPGAVVPMGGVTYTPPPAVVAPPTVMPGAVPVVPAIPAAAGHRPLFTLGQENYNVQIGQGIIGQPTAYVPGQGIRNFIRYLSP